MKILFLTHSFPYPLHEGVRLHVYHLLRQLSKTHELHLVCFVESDREREHLPQIQPFCKTIATIPHRVSKSPWRRLLNMLFQGEPYSVRQFTSVQMVKAIQELANHVQPDLVHVDFTVMAQYATSLPDPLPKVFFPHDAMSMLFERSIRYERNLLFRWYTANQAQKMKRYEGKILPWFEKTVVVSPVDKEALEARATGAVIVFNPNGVDANEFSPRPVLEDPHTVLFRGLMNFLPNYDAALFFAREVMPLIWARRPPTRLVIVGGGTSQEVRRRIGGDRRIDLLGFASDLREPMAQAAVIACPMRTGSGIKNKILEAMAMAKAVVATPMSLAGIDARPEQHLLTGETAEELAAQTIRLLDDAALRRAIGERARQFVLEHHTWEKHAKRFEQIYREAVAAGQDRI